MRVGARVDEEVVDEQSLTGFLTGLRQLGVVREHIDKTGLADIASTNEGIFGNSSLGTLHNVRTGNDE